MKNLINKFLVLLTISSCSVAPTQDGLNPAEYDNTKRDFTNSSDKEKILRRVANQETCFDLVEKILNKNNDANKLTNESLKLESNINSYAQNDLSADQDLVYVYNKARLVATKRPKVINEIIEKQNVVFEKVEKGTNLEIGLINVEHKYNSFSKNFYAIREIGKKEPFKLIALNDPYEKAVFRGEGDEIEIALLAPGKREEETTSFTFVKEELPNFDVYERGLKQYKLQSPFEFTSWDEFSKIYEYEKVRFQKIKGSRLLLGLARRTRSFGEVLLIVKERFSKYPDKILVLGEKDYVTIEAKDSPGGFKVIKVDEIENYADYRIIEIRRIRDGGSVNISDLYPTDIFKDLNW